LGVFSQIAFVIFHFQIFQISRKGKERKRKEEKGRERKRKEEKGRERKRKEGVKDKGE
jgi:hypothetical protein